ncbi:MAG: hypothetical protein ACETWM_17580 [Candidatus Lokiarchaeia archaeon]
MFPDHGLDRIGRLVERELRIKKRYILLSWCRRFGITFEQAQQVLFDALNLGVLVEKGKRYIIRDWIIGFGGKHRSGRVFYVYPRNGEYAEHVLKGLKPPLSRKAAL